MSNQSPQPPPGVRLASCRASLAECGWAPRWPLLTLVETFFSILSLIALVAGCSSAPRGLVHTSTSYRREVVLSQKHPVDDFINARLVTIAKDGATTIEVAETGERLTAAPGEYFVSSAYGTEGLQLVSASADRNEAHLVRSWCVTK
jgi:hypothetical protein